MGGVGLPELIVITLVVVLLFGAPILAFFMGYVVGKNRAATSDSAEEATATSPAPAPARTDRPPTPEEPAHE